jgi:Flp pilus assembly protein TadG
MRLKLNWTRKGEEGGSLVEMALVSAFIFLPTIFAIIEVSFAVYTYNYVSQMARLATRYAVVRGSFSCAIQSNFSDCNLGPGGGSNPTTADGSTALQNYVRGYVYPGINTSNVTVTATWWTADVTNPGTGAFSSTAWDLACTDTTAGACNPPTSAVKVTVNYSYPLNIPFWKQVTIPMRSTSEMVINE